MRNHRKGLAFTGISEIPRSKSMAQQTASPPSEVQSLAEDVLELSKHYRSSNGGLGQEPQLVVKAKELITAVQSPIDHAMSLLTTFACAATVRTLMSLKILQAIPTVGSITLTDLEKTTGVQAALTERLLRVVVSYGFIRFNDDRSYSHTRISAGYTCGMLATVFPPIFDEVSLLDALPGYFKLRGAKEPDGEKAMTHNPSTWRAGQEGKTAFELIEQDPERLAEFQQLMNMSAMFRPYTGFYDYRKLATGDTSRPVLVDVGGGDGHTMAKILEAHPELNPKQCIVQDREQTAELARKNEDLPEGVQCQGHDFFTPQPVKQARAYQFRACLHDWSDSQAIKILKQIVPAMAPDSKILIAENVLPETGVQGMASFMDMVMLCIGGKERTQANFESILQTAGLKLDGVYKTPGGMPFGMVEASLG